MRLRFPAQDSIIKILRRRYGDGLVKKVRKLEKSDFKYRKALLDFEFLQSCKKEKLIPTFLQFKVANKRLELSEAYLSCRRCLLNQEMSIKYKTIWALYNKIASMKNKLYNQMSFIDYVHVITKFLVSNDKNIYKIRKNQGKKLHNLFLNNSYHNSVTSHDPDKVIFNFSGHVLKSLLSKGLNFAIPPKNINYADYMLPFELLYRNVDSLEVSNLDKDFIKSRLRDSAFSSYKDTGKTFEKNLPKAEFDALKILLKNKDLIVQKADKGNAVVILNRKDYVCKMKNILNDSSKFDKVYIDHDKILNHLVHMENRVTDVLKNLRDKKEISIEQYKNLSPSGSRPGIMYGLAKVHKIVTDGLPSFRPILSAIGTPTYKLAKFLVLMLEPLITNEYTIKDSFTYAEELQSFDSKLVMASFDIESLFTNIPLQETIDLCVENLFQDRAL